MSRIFLVLLGFIVCLFIVEITSRQLYTKPWYVKLVEEQKSFKWPNSQFNKFYIRDKDYDVKDSDTYRILILGDSFTFGYGIDDPSNVFPKILERKFKSDGISTEKNIEVINAGISGSRSADWLKLFEKVKKVYQPDLVLIVFSLRNGTVIGVMQSFFTPIRNTILHINEKSFMYKHSYAYRLYKDSLDKKNISTFYTKSLKDAYFGTDVEKEEWRRTKKNILRLIKKSKKISARYGFVIFPTLVEFNENYLFKDICDEVYGFTTENNIPTLNLLDSFMGKEASDFWVSAYDQHPNEKANVIAAEAIYPFLKNIMNKKSKQ